MSDEDEIIRGSGNVFADFGDPDADAKRMKAEIAAEIIGVINRKSLTVRSAAAEAGCDPADIQRIRNADLSRFTLDRLVRIAARLGQHFELRSRPTGKAA